MAEESWHIARLKQERRATSALLAVMTAAALLLLLGCSRGALTKRPQTISMMCSLADLPTSTEEEVRAFVRRSDQVFGRKTPFGGSSRNLRIARAASEFVAEVQLRRQEFDQGITRPTISKIEETRVVIRAACDGTTPQPTRPAVPTLHTDPAIAAARVLCERALPGSEVTSATPATVGEIRRRPIFDGRPVAANAFSGLPDESAAAWCWTRGSNAYVSHGVALSTKEAVLMLQVLAGPDDPAPTGAPPSTLR